jgi:hypothetical protein
VDKVHLRLSLRTADKVLAWGVKVKLSEVESLAIDLNEAPRRIVDLHGVPVIHDVERSWLIVEDDVAEVASAGRDDINR